jgi:hypothetical protein
MSWLSSVSTVSYYRLDDRGSIPGREKRLFLKPVSQVQPWSPSNGYRDSLPGGKERPGRDADHSSTPM